MEGGQSTFYFSRPLLERTFDLGYEETYYAFQRMGGGVRLPALDIWGGVILSSAGKESQKLSLLFYLCDENYDKSLSESEVSIALFTFGRGFARMKGAREPPLSLCQQLARDVFSSSPLTEQGEVHTTHFPLH